MEVQVAITMKESLGQNHARNRLSAKLPRCSILEVGEPGDFTGNGIKKKRGLVLCTPTLDSPHFLCLHTYMPGMRDTGALPASVDSVYTNAAVHVGLQGGSLEKKSSAGAAK